MTGSKQHGLATRVNHGDHAYLGDSPAVAPDISVTTTFRHPSPAKVASMPPGTYDTEWDPSEPSRDIYARETRPLVTRGEKLLESIFGFPSMIFPSGVAAAYQLILHCRPDVIAITSSYHGVHEAIGIYRKTRGEENVRLIGLDDDYPTNSKLFVWLETPVNPTGEVKSIEAYAKKTHASGGFLAIDSTFGPPPLQDPLAWGADAIVVSGTKYLLGHSDALMGVVVVKDKDQWMSLWHLRTYTGSNSGSLENWLLLRSLRTLALRVPRQSETATALAKWLASSEASHVVEHVWHATLQPDATDFIGEGKQMSMGASCFAMLMRKPVYAEHLGHALKLFTPAASLGGVESLIEQRIIASPSADPKMIRLSIGLEDFEDLKADMVEGFARIVEVEKTVS